MGNSDLSIANEVTFGAGAVVTGNAAATSTVDFAGTAASADLLVEAATVTVLDVYTATGPISLDTGASLVVDIGASATVTTVSLDEAAASFDVAGSATFNGNGGGVTTTAGATMTVAGTVIVDATNVDFAASTTMSGTVSFSGAVSGDGLAIFNVGATVAAAGSVDVDVFEVDVAASVDIDGSVSSNTAATIEGSVVINSGGSLTLDGLTDLADEGLIDVSASGSLTIQGDVNAYATQATITASANSDVDIDVSGATGASADISAVCVAEQSSTTTVTGTVTFERSTVFGGSLTGSGSVVLSSSNANIQTHEVSGSVSVGTLTVDATASVLVDGFASTTTDVVVDGGSVVVEGEVEVSFGSLELKGNARADRGRQVGRLRRDRHL